MIASASEENARPSPSASDRTAVRWKMPSTMSWVGR